MTNPDRPPRLLVGLTGGIAAYKVCEVISQGFQQGLAIRAILTQGAQQFITPLTVSTLSRHPAYTDADFWQPVHPRPLHIELGEWGDLLLIAPATAHTLAKLAQGFADNLLTNTVLASRCPILIAPALNTDMWDQATVQANYQRLQAIPRYHFIGPGRGLLACDRRGAGRLAEPSEILAMVRSLLHTQGQRDLAGKTLLINGGGTREHFDPVRFIGNPASGKMGQALARAASHRGAKVIYVQGGDLPFPETLPQTEFHRVISSTEMQQKMTALAPQADWIIFCAAVGDVQPAEYCDRKLAKADLPNALPLVPVADIAAAIAQHRRRDQKLIGFAAQTGEILTPALGKLERKGLDAIVANAVDRPEGGFGSDENQGIFCDRQGHTQPLPLSNKLIFAHHILDRILTLPDEP